MYYFDLGANALVIPGNAAWNAAVSEMATDITTPPDAVSNQQAMDELVSLQAQRFHRQPDPTGMAGPLFDAVITQLRNINAPETQIQALIADINTRVQQADSQPVAPTAPMIAPPPPPHRSPLVGPSLSGYASSPVPVVGPPPPQYYAAPAPGPIPVVGPPPPQYYAAPAPGPIPVVGPPPPQYYAAPAPPPAVHHRRHRANPMISSQFVPIRKAQRTVRRGRGIPFFDLRANALVIPGNAVWNNTVSRLVQNLTTPPDNNSNVIAFENMASLQEQKMTGPAGNLAQQLFDAVINGMRGLPVPESQIQALIADINNTIRMSLSSPHGVEGMSAQQLVDSADNHFKQRANNLAKKLVNQNPRAIGELEKVKRDAASGDWSSRQILQYLKAALTLLNVSPNVINQATMSGEDVEREVASLIKRADHGDQNAMAMLEGVRAAAMAGNPLAKKAFNAALIQFQGDPNWDPMGDFSGDPNWDPMGDFSGDFGASRRAAHPVHHAPVHHTPPRVVRGVVHKMPHPVHRAPFKASTAHKKLAHVLAHPAAQQLGQQGGGSSGGGSGNGGGNGNADSSGDSSQDSSQDSSGDSSQQQQPQTPLDKLIAAAQAGDQSARDELDRFMHAEMNGDQRAASLMHAVRAKTVHSQKGKKARAVGMSHDIPLTTKRISAMAGDFGVEYGPSGTQCFWDGFKNPLAKIPANTSPDIARCFSQGQVAALARDFQAARVPGASITNIFGPSMGWEMGEMSNLTTGNFGATAIERKKRGAKHHGDGDEDTDIDYFDDMYARDSGLGRFGDEGQINAAEAGDPYFAQQQLARGDYGQIDVNQGAFRLKVEERNRLADRLDDCNQKIANLRGQLPPPPIVRIVVHVGIPEFSAEGQINAAQAGDPYFAQDQIGAGNVATIEVNQTAFRKLVASVEFLKRQISEAMNTIANLMAQGVTGIVTAPPPTLDVSMQPVLANPLTGGNDVHANPMTGGLRGGVQPDPMTGGASLYQLD